MILFMWTIFKVFIESVTILLLFYAFIFCLQGMWDLSSPTRDQTHTPALEGKVLTTELPRKSPSTVLLVQPFSQAKSMSPGVGAHIGVQNKPT